MVEMAKMVVGSVSLPVTVKTRIGYGPESHMPIRRLRDAWKTRVSRADNPTAHAQMGTPARPTDMGAKAREVVSIPVIVNGGCEE